MLEFKKMVYYVILLINIFTLVSIGHANIIEYKGVINEVTDYGQPEGVHKYSPYGEIGDLFKIQINFNFFNFDVNEIIIDIGYYQMRPIENSITGYFNSHDDWMYNNIGTLWQMSEGIFILNSDNFGVITKGIVYLVPEPPSNFLLLLGSSILLGVFAIRNRRTNKNFKIIFV